MPSIRRSLTVVSAFLLLSSAALAVDAQTSADEGGAVASPPESLRLEYKFKPGEYQRYDMTIIGKGSFRLAGQTEKSKLETRSELTFLQHAKAESPEGGPWTMEWHMIRGALTLPDFGEITLTIPSLRFEMDKAGKVSKLSGLEELAVSADSQGQQEMSKTLTQLISTGFPDRELKAGDTWEHEYKIELPGQDPITAKATSRLEGFEVLDSADCAKITTSYETPFKLKPGNSPEGEPNAAAAAEVDARVLSGTERGEFYMHFAYEEGRIARVSGTVEITADLGAKRIDASEAAAPADTHPEVAEQFKKEQELLAHDVGMRFTMTSVYNPKLPGSALQEEK